MIIIVVTSLNGVLAKKSRKKFSCQTINYQKDSNTNVEVKLCAKLTRQYISDNSLSRRAAKGLQNIILKDITSQRVSNNKALCPNECAQTVETVYVNKDCSDENDGDENVGDVNGGDDDSYSSIMDGLKDLNEENSNPDYI